MREIMWIRDLMRSMDVEVQKPILYCDIKPAISAVYPSGYHARSKHLDVKHKFLSECIDNGPLDIIYKFTSDMRADALMKALHRVAFKKFAYLMGLSDVR